MEKRILLGIFFAVIVTALAVGTVTYAQGIEEEFMAEDSSSATQGGMEVTIDAISANDQEATLQQIAAQLGEIETEVNRLSLLVSKVVLERQALALQAQLEAMQQGGMATGGQGVAVVTPPPAVSIEESAESMATEEMEVMEEEVMEQDESAVAQVQEVTPFSPIPQPTPTAEPERQEVGAGGNVADELSELPIPIVGSDEEEDEGGFFAAIREAVGGLGTPEFVTIFILAVLAIFVIARRVASRERKAAPAPVAPTASTAEPQDSPEGQQALDQQRQELQERVAWK